jgi:ribose transport system substrate-binding protein
LNNVRGWRHGLAREILVSLAGGLILTVGAKFLIEAQPSFAGRAPIWLVAALICTSTLAVYLITEPLAFLIVAALVRTHWLAGLLDGLVRSLDHHGTDLVVKQPPHRYGGQSQVLQLNSIVRNKHAYLGGFIVLSQPSDIQSELIA